MSHCREARVAILRLGCSLAVCILAIHLLLGGVSADSHSGYSMKNDVSINEKPYCSFFNNRAPTPQPLLKNCSMFKENSCCLQQEIDATFGKVKPLKGSSRECQIHMNYLMCYICAPTQHMFYSRERLTVCEDFCDALYDACKSAILKGSLISHLYQNGRSFCLSRSFEVAPRSAVRCFRYHSGDEDKNSSKNVRFDIFMILSCLIMSFFVINGQSEGLAAHSKITKKKGASKAGGRHKHFGGVAAISSGVIDAIFTQKLPKTFTAIILCSAAIVLFQTESVHSVRPSDVDRWTKLLSEDFSRFADEGLQFDAIQKAYFDASYHMKDVDGQAKLQDVKDKLELFFSKKKEMAEKLARNVADLYDTWSQSSPLPDSLSSLSREDYKDADIEETIPDYLVYSSDFNLPVLLNASTVKIPDDVDRSETNVIKTVMFTSKLDQLFKQNAELDPDLRWQYFGSTHGVHRQFPGREWQTNFIGFREDFDPRMRPWYIAATSGPKDIVIILDGSSSMEENEGLIKMQRVASTLINTMSQQDYLNVIVSRSTYYDNQGKRMDHEAESLACRSDRLLRGTVNLRKSILKNIQNLQLAGGSDHRGAFTKAFKLLDGPSKTGCQSIIIFITDADRRDKQQRCDAGHYRYDSESRRRFIPGDTCFYDYRDLIKHVDGLQEGRDEQVAIFSFVTRKENVRLPQKLSCRNRGMSVKIIDDEAIFKQMSPYFDHVTKQSGAREVVWTSPYIDNSGLGLTLTAAIPVYSNKTGEHLGVVGLDATLTSIERLLQYERWGTAYAFLIDEEATAIVHPFVKPSAQLLEDAIYSNIFTLETHGGKPAEFYQVVKQILQDKTGEYTIEKDAQRAVSFENALYWRPAKYTKYLFTHISGSGFYLVFNLGEGDDVVRYPRSPNSHGTTYFHDLSGYLQLQANGKLDSDLNVVKDGKKYQGVPITMEASVVQLAPRSFCHPNAYLRSNQPSLLDIHENINKPSSSSAQCPNGMFQAGVRADIHLTSKPEEEWKTRDSSVQDELVWTYIGTLSGVLRIFPGTKLKKTYDTVRRPWYNIALINRGKLAVSEVYLDASEIGKVVTFSKNIHKGTNINPDPSTCAAMPFGEGCYCKQNGDCKSKFCYRAVCASDQIQGVMALDIFYKKFYEKVTSHLKDNEKRPVCEAVYSCRYGDQCQTRCYIVNGAGNLVLDHAFLYTADKDRRLYEDVSLASKHGYIFHVLLNAGIYRSYTRTDYQGVCSLSENDDDEESDDQNWISPIDTSTPSVYNKTGPIPPFQNKYGCVKHVMYYQVNYSALNAAGSMIHGSLMADPCALGEYYFMEIPGTNLFLLILNNYVERKRFYNFNCHIENRVLKPGSYPAKNNLCITDETNIFKNITTRMCPTRRTTVDICEVSAANQNTLYLSVLNFVGLTLIVQFVKVFPST